MSIEIILRATTGEGGQKLPRSGRWRTAIDSPRSRGGEAMISEPTSAGPIKRVPANSPGSPLQHQAQRSVVDLWDRMRKPVWVWGDIDSSTGGFRTASLELVAEARRWVGVAEAVTVVSLKLPHLGVNRAFLDGADAVATLEDCMQSTQSWADALATYWTTHSPALMLFPTTPEGQSAAEALAAYCHPAFIEHLEPTLDFKELLRLRKWFNEGDDRDPRLGFIMVSPGTFASFDGCYRRTGPVVPVPPANHDLFDPV